jgi:CheY-like chemotaxis protein
MRKVLVIEDDESIRRSVGMMLRISGFEAFYAENGSIGLQLLQQSKPDIVICDIAMPVMDGYKFIEELRKIGEPSSKVPVIFLTAKASEEDIQRGKALGVNAYLTKPIWPADLLKAVQENLGIMDPPPEPDDAIADGTDKTVPTAPIGDGSGSVG